MTAPLRKLIRFLVFENLAVALAVTFAASQVLLAMWAWTVLAAQPAGPLGVWAATAATLAAGHFVALRGTRTARVLTYSFRPWSQVYVVATFSLAFVAAAVGFASGAFAAVASMLGLAGPNHALALTVLQSTTGMAALAAAGSVAGGLAAARRLPLIRAVRLEVPGLPAGLSGLRIAHLSDIHVGNGYDTAQITRLVDQVNALDADIVALTGDIFDRDPSVVAPAASVLAGLRARYGVFAVLGNHDAYVGKELVAAALARHAPAIRLLRGEIVAAPTDPPIHIAGIDDPGDEWRVTPDGAREVELIARKRAGRSPCLLLVHRPDVFAEVAAAGFTLVLSGHYHGGQIALPGSRGTANPARLISRYYAGSHRVGASLLHVTRGIGCAGPRLRIACPPEISLLRLTSGK